jgi:hypothetical protein
MFEGHILNWVNASDGLRRWRVPGSCRDYCFPSPFRIQGFFWGEAAVETDQRVERAVVPSQRSKPYGRVGPIKPPQATGGPLWPVVIELSPSAT